MGSPEPDVDELAHADRADQVTDHPEQDGALRASPEMDVRQGRFTDADVG